MRKDISHTFESKYHNIKLVATEYVEDADMPFWRYEFYINDDVVKNTHIGIRVCSKLYADLSNFTFSSDDGKYLFIPKRSTTIYNSLEKRYFEADTQIERKNNDFVKNIFALDKLIIIQTRGIQIITLSNYHVFNVLFPLDKYHLKDVYFESNKVYVKYYNIKKSIVECRPFDFRKMDFEI